MFFNSLLLDVLAGRGIEDIDAFLKDPTWNDLLDPMSIPFMEQAVNRVLKAIRERERIAIHGDYDCDGVLGAHVLRSVLMRMGSHAQKNRPHPNMSGQGTLGAHLGESSGALMSGGSQFIFAEPVPIVHYEFPTREAGMGAVSMTAGRAFENATGLLDALKQMSTSPFSTLELIEITGSELGIQGVSAASIGTLPKVGRNEQCPCGSGKKYKKCHGNTFVN